MSRIKERLKQYKDEYSKHSKSDELYVVDALKMIEQLQDDLEQNEKKNSWIPLEERLPEEQKRALFTNKYGDMMVGYIYACSTEGDYNCEGDGADMFDCVAWMPLPEPYKED